MIEPWPVRRSEPVYGNKIFRIRADWCADPRSGEEHPFWLIECRDWANVVARLEDGRYILIRQWRFGTKAVSVEVPGGIVDAGERPEEAAARELVEEAGYVAARGLVSLGTVDPNPAIFTNRLHVFAAEGCRPAREHERRAGDETEQIEVVLAGEAELEDLVLTGAIGHSNVLAAILRYRLWKGSRGA